MTFTEGRKQMTICDAIQGRQLVEFSYGGHNRIVIPAAYGIHKTTGNRTLRGYQVGGTSNTRRPPFWSMFTEDEMLGLTVLDETFDEVPSDYNPDDAHIDVICCL